jgi:hypothetical protein
MSKLVTNASSEELSVESAERTLEALPWQNATSAYSIFEIFNFYFNQEREYTLTLITIFFTRIPSVPLLAQRHST